MINKQIIEDLSNKINELVKSSPLSEVNKNVYALIQGAFTKMELVSRQEFDVQAEVLRKARERLQALEVRLAELEAQLKATKPK